MRLLLTSAGISNPSIQAALDELLGKPVSASSALFIPTAIYGVPGGPDIIRNVIRGSLGDPFCELGWKSLGPGKWKLVAPGSGMAGKAP